ncbi:MAG: type IV toxin-antitoxin system AbiEi family antitoxin [bacterium]
MIKGIELEKQIERAFRELLSGVPSLNIKNVPRLSENMQPDFVFVTNDTIRPQYIVVEVKSNGEPRYVRSAIQQLRGHVSRLNNAYGVVGAPYITDDTANICKENGVGYIDTAGNCYLNFNKILIDRKNYPNPNIVQRTLRTIFSTKAARILRIMFNNPKKQWQVQELAKEADVSLGLAYKVKERLLDLEYASGVKKRIVLSQPQKLLDEWTEIYSFRKNKIFDYYGPPVKLIETKLSQYCKAKGIRYAFALFSGAARVAPYTRYTRGFAYIGNGIKKTAQAIGLKQVDSGANFTLMEPHDEGVFLDVQKVQGVMVVSDIQLYLDLRSYKGRGEDAAQFLMEQKIKPKW